MFRASLAVCFITFLLAGAQAGAEVIDLPTRPGVTIRTLLERAPIAIGSVVLIAGGPGRLDLTSDGRLGRGGGNQLVRSRALYVAAGFITAVPDIAAEFKQGDDVAPGYRWSVEHAADLGAVVRHLRALKAPVYIVGTSMGALSVANAVARLSGSELPDAFVITSGLLMQQAARMPSVERDISAITRTELPALLVAHRQDSCRFTPASDAPRFRRLLAASKRVEVVMLDGGGPPLGNVCEARHFHGFEGLDREVTATITDWLKALAPQR